MHLSRFTSSVANRILVARLWAEDLADDVQMKLDETTEMLFKQFSDTSLRLQYGRSACALIAQMVVVKKAKATRADSLQSRVRSWNGKLSLGLVSFNTVWVCLMSYELWRRRNDPVSAVPDSQRCMDLHHHRTYPYYA